MNRLALCFALDLVQEETPDEVLFPEWIEILPAGAEVEGVDGRKFLNPNPQGLIDEFDARKNKFIPVDINHDSEINHGWNGRAIGWVTALELRDGAVWARVEWNWEGKMILRDRAFRFVSPAFIVSKEKEILRFTSVGLVNHPNFEELAALNGREDRMDREVLQALGLAESATPEDAVRAINAIKPTPERFVPRADYDLVLNRATAAETRLKELGEKALNDRRKALLERGEKEQKIDKGSLEFWTDYCSSLEACDKFEAHLNKVSPIIQGGQTAPSGSPLTSRVLNGQQKKLAQLLGVSEADLLKELGNGGA